MATVEGTARDSLRALGVNVCVVPGRIVNKASNGVGTLCLYKLFSAHPLSACFWFVIPSNAPVERFSSVGREFVYVC